MGKGRCTEDTGCRYYGGPGIPCPESPCEKPYSSPGPIPIPKLKGNVATYDVARAMLEELHAAIWPNEVFGIATEEGRDKAAVWITKLVDELNSIRNMVNNGDMTVQQAAKDYRRMTEGR